MPLLGILAGSAFVDYFTTRRIADDTMDQALADNLFDLEAHLQAIPPGEPLQIGDEARAMLRSKAPDVLYFAVRDDAGTLLLGAPDLPAAGPDPAGNAPRYGDGRFRGQAVRVAELRMDQHGRALDIVIAQTTLRRREVQRSLLAAMLWPNLAVVVLALTAVGFGVRRGLQPLTTVEQEIANRSPSDLRPFDLAAVPSEIRPMLRRLNELFELVRQASLVQQRFIADAAHQLKTPLAALRNQVDLAMGADVDGAERQWLVHVDQATGRMSHLLDRLLAHARAESAEGDDAMSMTVAMDQLVEESATDFLDLALARNVDLGFEIVPAAVTGSRWMLKEALANLIDNAIRYVPPGGVVTVRCGSDAGRAYLEVQDNGPGIAPDQRARAVERFHRLPGSPGDGCGMGLAIVQEIARRHGAMLSLHTAEGGGLRVRLDFAP